MLRRRAVLFTFSGLILGGCSPAQSQAAPTVAAPPTQRAEPLAETPSSPPSSGQDELGDQEPGDDGEVAPAEPGPSLPEVRLRLLGMHIGGGPNDEASKRPFLEAVSSSFPAMLSCYRLVDAPERGGSFGVDLRIPREGGAPSVEQLRTRLGPEAFVGCMREALLGLRFAPPPRGPTVVSVSVAFALEG